MTVAIWIIAVCEIIRAAQNMLQIAMLKRDSGARDNAYAEFVKSLKDTDKEFVRKMLEEFEFEGENHDHIKDDRQSRRYKTVDRVAKRQLR